MNIPRVEPVVRGFGLEAIQVIDVPEVQILFIVGVLKRGQANMQLGAAGDW